MDRVIPPSFDATPLLPGLMQAKRALDHRIAAKAVEVTPTGLSVQQSSVEQVVHVVVDLPIVQFLKLQNIDIRDCEFLVDVGAQRIDITDPEYRLATGDLKRELRQVIEGGLRNELNRFFAGSQVPGKAALVQVIVNRISLYMANSLVDERVLCASPDQVKVSVRRKTKS